MKKTGLLSLPELRSCRRNPTSASTSAHRGLAGPHARPDARHGDAYRVYAPGRKSHTWVFNHPDDVRRILISNHRNYTKGVGFDRIKILLGNGIIVSEGEFWKRQRRMMQPTFHRRILAQFDAHRARNDRLLAEWQAQVRGGEPVNVTDDMSEMTLEIVLRSIFGDDLERLAQETGENPFAVLTEEPARDLRSPTGFASSPS